MFAVTWGDGKLKPDIAVNVFSGELSCCTEDGEIKPYSEFPLYDPAVDAICDWNGTFEEGRKFGHYCSDRARTGG